MAAIFILILFALLFYFFLDRRGGAILSLVVLFPELPGILMNQVGLEGYNTLLRFVLYSIVLIMNLDVVRRNRRRVFADATSILLYMVVAVMFILNLYVVGRAHSDPEVSDFQINVVIRILVPYILVLLTFRDRKTIVDFCNAINIWAFLYIAVLFFLFGTEGISASDRMTIQDVTGVGPIELSRVAAIISVTSFCRLIERESRLKVLYIVFIAIGLYILFLSSQRGSIIGAVASILFIFYFSLIRQGRSGTFVLVAAVLFLLVGFLITTFQFSFLERFADLENFREYERYFDYGLSWQAFSDNGYFWGLGTRGYFYFTDEARPYPHSYILEQMVEYGLIGLIYAIVIIAQGIRSSIKVFTSNQVPESSRELAAAWVMMLCSVLVSGSFLTNAVFPLLTAALLSVVSYANGAKEKKHSLCQRT